jgi:hypothetical protein
LICCRCVEGDAAHDRGDHDERDDEQNAPGHPAIDRPSFASRCRDTRH